MALSEIGSECLDILRRILVGKGYGVEVFPELKGHSGFEHTVPIYATTSRGAKIMIDIKEKEADEFTVLSLYLKALDVKPTHAFLVSLGELTEKAQALAKKYRISILEVDSASDLRVKFLAALPSAASLAVDANLS